MGDAAIDSDDSQNDSDSEPEDMTDEQMMSLDEVIGNAFKSMKVSKKKEQQQLQLQKENFRFSPAVFIELLSYFSGYFFSGPIPVSTLPTRKLGPHAMSIILYYF